MLWINEYLIFLLKTATIFTGIIATIICCKQKEQPEENQKVSIKNYNKQLSNINKMVAKTTKTKLAKTTKKPTKKPKLFVVTFKGDINASQAKTLGLEVTTIINAANPKTDKVLVLLESPGGCVHGYGYAAAQLLRLKQAKISLDISVNKVAASGGYLMACIADKIIASPFAIIGSIGVILQLPNLNKLLKEKNIEFEQLTAGEYKRTLTLFGKNDAKAKAKAQAQVDKIHEMFKQFVRQNRPCIDIDAIATGEYWHALEAINLKLIDEIATSEEYLLQQTKKYNIFKINAKTKLGILQKVSNQVSTCITETIKKITHADQIM